MNLRHDVHMMEAARLARLGRFKEALAVLGGASASAADSTASRSGPPSLSDLLPLSAGHPARSAPIPLPNGARFDERSYSNAFGSRGYKLYVPSRYCGQALPLVVMLHGCTQSPDDFAAGTRMNLLGEEGTFLVAYPAQDQSANISRCWNWFSAADQQRERGEPSLIAGITRQIMGALMVTPGRVYIAGLSAGGAQAAIMGSTYPDLYAAVGIHSGLACGAASDLPSAFAAMRQGAPRDGWLHPRTAMNRPVPTIVFHGDRDTTVNPINGDQIIARSNPGAELRTIITSGETGAGIAYTRTAHVELDRAADRRTVGRSRGGSCMVGGKRRWFVHRSARTRCQPRDGALLPSTHQSPRPLTDLGTWA